MSYQIDHLFVLSAGHEAALDRLAGAGFSLAARRDHPGQGTANTCVHLENGYLEILWVARPDEVVSDLTRPTGLDERSRWRETGASPVGVALRVPHEPAPPFPCFAYRPVYLPGEAAILIADEPVEAGAPLAFVLPAVLKGHDVAVDHANGARQITSIAVAMPKEAARLPAPTLMRERGLCRIETAPEPALHVELDGGRLGRSLDLRPLTPLTLSW